MVKILSQSGNSLADMYDVVGSIAGIEQLQTRELPIVHEMGATLFSERFNAGIRRMTTVALAQNTNFDVVIANLGRGIGRIFHVVCLANQQARALNVMVALRSTSDGREIPIFIWDTNDDVETAIRIDDNGTHLFKAPLHRHCLR